MRYRIHNNDSTDFVEYEADTIEEIREMSKGRRSLPTWGDGWSERLD